jgi:tetratricopeptide (TPR) repeat protein
MNQGGASSIIVKLHNALPESIYPWVIAALRQDPVVWKKLQEPAFHQHILSLELSVWTSLSPANLALLAIAEETTKLKASADPLLVNKLRSEIQYPVHPALRKMAAAEYEATSSTKIKKLTAQSPKDGAYPPLVKAGLLALALRERRRMVGTWEGLREELNGQTQRSGQAVFPTWRTPLACLYGMIPDASQMLLSLLSLGASEEYFQLAAHALLSNPVSPEKLTEEVQALLDKLFLPETIPLLQQFSLQRPEMAASLAGRMQSKSKDTASKAVPAQPGLDKHPLEQITVLSRMLLLSEAQRLSKNVAASQATLEQAWQTVQHLEAGLAAELASTASENGGKDQAVEFWQKAVSLAPDSPLYRARLAMAFLETGHVEGARAWLPDEDAVQDKGDRGHPEFLVAALASARLAIQTGDTDAARKAALSAIEFLLSHDKASPLGTTLLKTIREMAVLLLELGLPVEATHTIQALTDQYPNDPDLLSFLGQAQYAAGQASVAAESLQIAVALAPQDLDLRRRYAQMLEAAGEWQTALGEWTRVLGGAASQPSNLVSNPHDLCAFAKCALKAGEPQSAADACQKVLAMEYDEDSPDNFALAHLMLGQALEQQGDNLAAQEQFKKATQLLPHRPEAWLALAEMQANAGQTQLAVETLRAGGQAAPDAPEIYLALGNAYLLDWENHGHPSPTQALDMFQKAADLITNDGGYKRHPEHASQVSLRLGETLYELGHLEESRKVLEVAYQANPSFPGLAQIYARSLLELKDQRAAIPVLAHVIQVEDDNLFAHLDYATAILSVRENPQEAIASLRRVQELSPGHIQAQALLAEALAENDELTDALHAYQTVLETDLVEDPAWCSRISLGLGRTALALQQPDIAIAALQEASLADPQNPQIPRTLAEAYYTAGLLEDALQTARIGLGLALEDLDILIWFAEKAIQWVGGTNKAKTGYPTDAVPSELIAQVRTEALNTLTRAIQLAPQRTDLLIRLGRVQLLIEDTSAALESFQKVLSAPVASIDDLQQAAEHLLELGNPQSAIECLEKAIAQSGYTKGQIFGVEKYTCLAHTLIKAYQEAGNAKAALSTLDQAISYYPIDVSLSSTKANILLEIGRPQEALASLEDALQAQPDGQNAPYLHKQAAGILRSTGDLPGALAHVERIIQAPDLSPVNPHQLWARILAAEIARALLQPEKAYAYLNMSPIHDQEFAHFSLRDQKDYREYFLLDCEIALDREDEKAADKSYCLVKDHVHLDDLPYHEKARVLAIESRLNAVQGNHHAALQAYRDALSYVELCQQNQATGDNCIIIGNNLDYHSLVNASLQLCQWENAIKLLEEAIEKSPLEPLPQIDLARALVLQAENRRLQVELDVVNHNPQAEATGEVTFQRFEQAIKAANEAIYRWSNQPSQDGKSSIEKPESAAALIARWKARGLAVFHPNRETAEALSHLPTTYTNPEDIAALIATLRESGKLETEAGRSLTIGEADLAAQAIQTAHNYPSHPSVLVQLALTLVANEAHFEEAYQATWNALINEFGEEDGAAPDKLICPHPLYPLFHVLVARISFLVGDLARSLNSIQAALECWPDEPRWHTLAAAIYRSVGDVPSSIIHLEQAVELEPDNMSHYLKLGQSYLHQAQSVLPGGAIEASMNAIQILEKACELSTSHAEPWLSLARAHLCAAQDNSLDQAAACAERAIQLDPDSTEPLVLRAEIALKAGDFQEAYDRSLIASRLEELSRLSGDEDAPVPQTNPYPILLLVRALDGLGRTTEAIAAIDKALPHVWERLPLLLERLQLISRTQDAENLLSALQELAQEFPDEPIVLAPLAKSLAIAGDTENAVLAAQKALQSVKSSADTDEASYLDVGTQAQLHHLLGKMLREAGQLDQAIHHLNEAVRQSPHSMDTYLELGRAFQDRRQHMQALQIYSQAMEISPDRPEPYFHAGLALKESKDYLGAESMLRRAADLAPTDLIIHRQLGAVVALNLVHNRRKKPMEA